MAYVCRSLAFGVFGWLELGSGVGPEPGSEPGPGPDLDDMGQSLGAELDIGCGSPVVCQS